MSDPARIAAARVRWTHQQARPEQLPPDEDWRTWLYLAGRGAGKTRTAAEWLAWQAVRNPNTRWAIVAPTYGDARDTCVEGESGILTVLRRYDALIPGDKAWNRSMGEIRLENGSRIKLFSGDEPDRLRGPQHHGGWFDELAAMRYPDIWAQYLFGLRLGTNPQTIVTTTPKPKQLIRELSNRNDGTVVISRGSTFDNANNLAPSALAELMARYEGTRIGRQELYGEILEDVEGALWTMNLIEANRVAVMPDVVRRIVAVDPAVTNNSDSDETGIIVASRDRQGHGYVEADYSMRGRPDAWARRVVKAYDEHECDAIVIEVNQGGDLVAQVLRTIRDTLPIREVRASKGKKLRAEPISALYEQGRVHHVKGLDTLEEQMTTWTPDDAKSPDRIDALVWALTDLMEQGGAEAYLRSLATICGCGYPNPVKAGACSRCGASLAN